MLHIVNGGATEGTLKRTSLPGEFFSFRDALINGPAPAGIYGEAWCKVRAEHLANSYGMDQIGCAADLAEQERVLESFSSHEEVTLWFEHDVFCQLNLLYLLDWFSHIDLGPTRLSLINIGAFAGRPDFRGLGELNPDELASLFPQRHEVKSDEFALASRAWQAFRSPNPTLIEQLLQDGTSALPFLRTALAAHLQRFPSVENGLGRIENRCLQLIDAGSEKFIDLFPRFIESEAVYGLGDTQVWNSLDELKDARTPLISSDTDATQPEVTHQARFTITPAGREVLQYNSDSLDLNGIDTWLGGVHLTSNSDAWRWSAADRRLVEGLAAKN